MTKLQEILRHMRILERMMQPASKAGQNAPRISLRAESESDASALLRALASRSLTSRRFRRI